MCTVSWLHRGDGFELYCNRDEKRSRAPGAGPEIGERGGVRFIAPVDPQAGGAWIGVNERGLAMCLLNGFPSGESRERVSRGLLIPELLPAASTVEAVERIVSRDLSTFAPFTLAMLAPGRPVIAMEWDGFERTLDSDAESRLPLVSSSHDPAGVWSRRRTEWRRSVIRAGRPDPETLFAFHSSHTGGASAYSPCMHRPDAETVSFSRVRVTRSEIDFAYHAGSPCRRAAVEIKTLPRSR
jgi:hypothetical protein